MSNVKLNRVLVANAMFSILCSVDLLLFSDIIAEYMGGFDPQYLLILGVSLIIFGGFVLWVSRQPENARLASEIVFMDRSWVVGSVILMFLGSEWFSTAGLAIITVVAVIVAVFAELQNRYIKLLQLEAGER
ncbi:hypothetical protein [Aliikangiella coralliicola]|uniref:Uncharacterized protein n=1 Tax=Aliikangiella coralliicola TaxID=2592383 RepID=A0A545UFY0_9GAMM|nr:hypothetical protein [Aliikangiella coralliicola]TQV88386.1 hypothetical protein FLL46_07640 [Aliikangiella coralliicola]